MVKPHDLPRSHLQVLSSRQSLNNALVQEFQSASWVWTEALDMHGPAADHAFRATYSPRAGVAAVSASVLITADDYFTLYVNGQVVGGTRSQISSGATVWADVHGYSIALNINGVAPIVFAVLGTNNADSAAGILAAIQITLADGSTATMATGGSGWRSASQFPQNFEAPNFDDSNWGSPVSIEKNGDSAPWGPIGVPSALTQISLTPSHVPSAPSSSSRANTPGATTKGSDSAQSSTGIMPVTSAGPGGITNTSEGGTSGGISVSGSIGGSIVAPGTSVSSSGTRGFGNPTITSNPLVAASVTADPGSNSAAQLQSNLPIGAIVGGAVGGVGLFLLLLLLWLCFRRKKREEETAPATMMPYTAESSPGPSLLPIQPRPFTVFTTAGNDPALRSAGHYRQETKSSAAPGSTSSGRSQTSEELNTTLQKLQELTLALNRGLADHGQDTPRIALTLSGPAGNMERTEQDGEEPLPPPYFDQRQTEA